MPTWPRDTTAADRGDPAGVQGDALSLPLSISISALPPPFAAIDRPLSVTPGTVRCTRSIPSSFPVKRDL